MTGSALKRNSQSEDYQNIAMNDYGTNTSQNRNFPGDKDFKDFIATDKSGTEMSSDGLAQSTE